MERPASLSAELWDQLPQTLRPGIASAFAALEARLAELERRLGLNSTNSSKPPSSDGPEVKRSSPKKKSGKKRGGQPRHKKHQRAILPPTNVIDRKPPCCAGCGNALAGTDPSPELFQHIEIPPIKPIVTHYMLHELTCRCGTTTKGALPENVVHHDGPGVHALVTHLLVACRQSRRMVCTLMKDVFGVPMSAGHVCKIQNRATKLFAPVLHEIREAIKSRDLNVDETGFKEKSKRKWLWVAKAKDCAAYLLGNRGHATFEELVGKDFGKVCTTDRLKTYNYIHHTLHQFCWAHLLRDFQAMVDRGNAGSPIGETLLKLAKAMFGLWFKVRDGTMDRERFRREVQPIRGEILQALSDGQFAGCAKTAACCAQLFEDEEKMWTFLDHDGVEPTNNAAERALRCAAIWRKLCFGTQSESGSRFVESALTIWQTCKLQGKNAYIYLRDSFEAATRGERPASLVGGGV
jgi:transposase